MRSAISPRLAMRTLRNTLRPPTAAVGRELDEDQVLAVLDRVARLDEARPDDAVRRRDDLLRDAEHVHRAEPVAGPHLGPGTCLGPWLEDADRRRGRHDPAALAARAVARIAWLAPGRARRRRRARRDRVRPGSGRVGACEPACPAPERAARSRSPGRRSAAPEATPASPGRRSRTRQPPSRTSSSPRPVAPSLAMRAGSSSVLRRSIAAWSAERSAAVRSGRRSPGVTGSGNL